MHSLAHWVLAGAALATLTAASQFGVRVCIDHPAPAARTSRTVARTPLRVAAAPNAGEPHRAAIDLG